MSNFSETKPSSAKRRTIADLFDLTGRTAWVTGASGYLGAALAEALSEAGARVVVSSRRIEAAREAAERLPDPQRRGHLAVAMDHLDEVSIEAAVQEVLTRTEGIDILVNNGHAALGADWTSVTGEQFSDHLRNLTGYFLLSRHVRDQAVQRARPASIVLLGSMYGVVGSYPDAYAGICASSPVAYHALKGGIVHMTRHLAVYWAGDQVRVNCLSPGPFPNRGSAPPELVERLIERSPMRRMGSPEELKGAVVYLASDASSYVTGQNLIVDGGWTAW
ncbi:MAG: SDR family oxidoreductase [Planctomycetales bacterium]|nr:SDR family oxidoreductase [Planctomycetales bacterium]